MGRQLRAGGIDAADDLGGAVGQQLPGRGEPDPSADPLQQLRAGLGLGTALGLALAAEPEERGLMQRPPRPPQESIFAHGLWQHIVWVGLLMAGVTEGAGA